MKIRNLGNEVATAKEARLGIELLPLLRKQLRIDSMALTHATVSIEQGHDGRFNFQAPEGVERTIPAIAWTNVSVSDGTRAFTDLRTGRGFQAGPCDLHADRVQLPTGTTAHLLQRLSATAAVDAHGCATVVQRIHGSFDKPEVEKPNVLASLSGSVGSLFKQAKRLFGGKCDVFYTGSVIPPE